MDTKLKKTHKLKIIIILLCIIVPAIVLVSLYPRMEKFANEKLDNNFREEIKCVERSFIDNALALTAKYYYNSIKDEEQENTLKKFMSYDGIIEKYTSMVCSNTCYVCVSGENVHTSFFDNGLIDVAKDMIDSENYNLSVERMKKLNIAGYYVVKYDEYGNCTLNQIYCNEGMRCEFDPDTVAVEEFPYIYGEIADDTHYDKVNPADYRIPKNITSIFFIGWDSQYIYTGTVDNINELAEAYFDIGAWLIFAAMVVFVALAALLLPFIKKLETGYERIFSIPAVFIAAITLAGIGSAVGMSMAMICTNLDYIKELLKVNGDIVIIGYTVTPEVAYNMLLVANVIGWSLCFFMEYIVVSAVRQFICHPVKYLKEKLYIIRIFKWLKVKVRKICNKIKEVICSIKPNKLIIMVLLANLVFTCLACICWIFGIPLIILYTIVIYLMVYKKGIKIRGQYDSVKEAAEKMADGNLKIELDEDLGVFKPIGDELVKVKDGFSKALIEEAKSRDMKTELITNVSHDLKTPLTAIITYIDLLKNENLSEEEKKQYINTLDMKSQRLKVLIEDLFEVSKANSGNVQVNYMDVDVVDLLKQVRLELEDKIADSRLTFKWKLPEEKVILKLDGQKTYRIFENLINNIIKYSLTGSRAFVEIDETEDKVTITFKNISATEIECDVENLTERFVRGDASRNSEGSGLGLAIVKSFVELQDGKFNIEVDGDLFKAVVLWNK